MPAVFRPAAFVKSVSRLACSAGLVLGLAAPAHAECGGDFPTFLRGIKTEALKKGHSSDTLNRFLANARQDGKVIASDRKQGVFQLDFTSFSKRLIFSAPTSFSLISYSSSAFLIINSVNSSLFPVLATSSN